MEQDELYSIGEVARFLELKESQIRFWEKQIPVLSPKRKNNSTHRRYTAEDVKILKRIKELRFEQNFKLQGVIQQLNKELSRSTKQPESDHSYSTKTDYKMQEQGSFSFESKEVPTKNFQTSIPSKPKATALPSRGSQPNKELISFLNYLVSELKGIKSLLD